MEHLDGTPVRDLSPILQFPKIVDVPTPGVVSFRNTAATIADPRLAEIANIEDHVTRARQLRNFLKGWEVPV